MQPQPAVQDAKFAFVQSLAEHLSRGDLEIPSFPDVVVRIRQALADEDCSTADLVKLLGAEPALAARLLKIANSAALRPGTHAVTELNMAVTRLGQNMVRNTVMSFGLQQMSDATSLEEARPFMERTWDRSTYVAALCYVLARKFTRLNADEALLAGLMHGVGKLYIITQAEHHPDLFANTAELEEILEEWHSAIGSAILESWSFSEEISAAVSRYRETEYEHDGDADLTDVLIVSSLLADFFRADVEDTTEVHLQQVPASAKLAVEATDFFDIMRESDEHISSLRKALGK